MNNSNDIFKVFFQSVTGTVFDEDAPVFFDDLEAAHKAAKAEGRLYRIEKDVKQLIQKPSDIQARLNADMTEEDDSRYEN